LRPEDGGDKFLRNVGKHLRDLMSLQPRTPLPLLLHLKLSFANQISSQFINLFCLAFQVECCRRFEIGTFWKQRLCLSRFYDFPSDTISVHSRWTASVYPCSRIRISGHKLVLRSVGRIIQYIRTAFATVSPVQPRNSRWIIVFTQMVTLKLGA
jgi:hypothetical protein